MRKLFIKLVCILFLLRIFSDLPTAAYNIGWISFKVDFPFTQLYTFFLLFFLVLLIIVKPGPYKRITINNIFVVGTYLIISSFISFYNYSSLEMSFTGIPVILIRYVVEIAVVLFVLKYFEEKGDLIILKNLLVKPAVYIILLFSIIQILTSSYQNIQGIERLAGPFSNPNVLGPFLNLFIILILFYRSENMINLWNSMLVIPLIFILWMTGSLTSIIANCVFFLLMFFKLGFYKKKMFYVFVPVALISGIYIISQKWDSILNRISIVINPDTFSLSSASSISWRIEAWQHYLNLINNYSEALFGLGLGIQRFIFLNGHKGNLSYIFEAPGTHNDYLAIFIDFGIIGLIIFFYLIYLLIKQINAYSGNYKSRSIVKYFVISILIMMLMDNYIDGLILWVIMFVVLSILRIDRYQLEKLCK